MPAFWKRFFRGASSDFASVPTEFYSYADKAILLLTNSDGQLEDKQVLELLTAQAVPHREAVELLLFLPVAFCRHLLPQIKWHRYYWEYISEKRRIKRLYTDNKRYAAIQTALHNYLNSTFTKDDYHKIAGRSASFHAINKLLLDNPTQKLADILVTPETVIY